MIGTVIFCLVVVLVLSGFAWVALSALHLYDSFRKPLILRYGKKFRIVKATKLVQDCWNEKHELEERYRLEVYTLGIWMLYDWWKSTDMCERDIEEIKKWRLMHEEAKEAKKNKEVIKEDVL